MVRDYRCFHGRQRARLAPLTLIVGENSTGKTSFMAMVRALWDIAHRHTVPDFKEEPYDLGSFFEIAHHRGARGGRADSFEAGFRVGPVDQEDGFSFHVAFRQRGTAPFPGVRRICRGDTSVEVEQENGKAKATVKADGREWSSVFEDGWFGGGEERSLVPLDLLTAFTEDAEDGAATRKGAYDAARLVEAATSGWQMRPFASAPVRSKPQRTYNPRMRLRDPEGDYVPMYLAELYRRQRKREWNALKERLEAFGAAAGLFDELSIKSFGVRESEPFQVLVRKRGERTKGPWRNLMDVGYGVSQVLPLVTELVRPDATSSMFLLQQPEVHLHPSAQAALGTLFGEVAKERQLIVETHDDGRLVLVDRKEVPGGRK